MSNRLRASILGGALILSVLGGLAFLNPYLDSDGDNAGYIMLAMSIASGQGFTSINFPEYLPHTMYNPLYPLVLAPIVAIWPHNYLLLKLPSLVFTIIFIICIWFLMESRTRGSLLTLGLLVGAVAVNRYVAEHAAATMKEAQFVAFSFAALAYAERLQRGNRIRDGVMIGLLAAASYLTWPMGIVVGASVVLSLLLRKYKVCAIVAASIIIVTVAGWSYRNVKVVESGHTFSHPVFGNDNYSSEFLRKDMYRPELGELTLGEFINKWRHRLPRYVDPLANISHPAFTVGLFAAGKHIDRPLAFGIPFLVLIMLGWGMCAREKIGAAELYFAFYVGIVTLYPIVRVRYMLPVMPLALYYLFRGSDVLIAWLRRRAPEVSGAAGAGGVVVLVSALLLSGLLVARQARLTLADDFGPRGRENLYERVDPGSGSYFRALDWLREHSGEREVIMCVRPWIAFLVSGRRTTVFQLGDAVPETVRTLHRHRVDYVIEDTAWYWQTREFLRPVLEAYPAAFELIHTEPDTDTRIYRVHRQDLPAAR